MNRDRAPVREGPPDLLARVLAGRHPDFALLHRPETAGAATIDVVAGEVGPYQWLADVPLPDDAAPAAAAGPGPVTPGTRHDVLLLIPYRQLAERGFAARDDGAPLLAMRVTHQQVLGRGEVVDRIPDRGLTSSGHRFDVDDEEYAATVRRIVGEEIGSGRGANFVVKRTFELDVEGYHPGHALTFFRRLLEREQGAYWTFLIHAGGRTLVGATPERHLGLCDGLATMNPISGTYRYPTGGPTLGGVLDFLGDRKETDELYMVLDEELKMMARICDRGGRVRGPYLKEMARLAHTEYVIEGRTTRDLTTVLRESLFAPTVTGSPVESAAEVIHRYEPHGRGYYGGVAALIGRDGDGGAVLDSAILIRTAQIEPSGRVRIPVGATLVRHSDPDAEAAETRAKVSGLLSALDGATPDRFARHPDVAAALRLRNRDIAGFWLTDRPAQETKPSLRAGTRVLIIDAEDTFTAMIAHQLRALGAAVTVRTHREPFLPRGYDLVVLGPGPGDPRKLDQPKIARLREAVDLLLARRHPFLAVCLSHQVLGLRLGLPLVRRELPNQGVQREIDLFGCRERVGFYNTFSAVAQEDKIELDDAGLVHVSRDRVTGEVHALRGETFSSMQFHAESVLTVDGPRIIAQAVRQVLP